MPGVEQEREMALQLIQAEFDRKFTELHGHFNRHIAEYEANRKLDRITFDLILEEQKKTNTLIAPIVEKDRDMKGIWRQSVRIQAFFNYFVKWPVIAAGLYKLADWAGLIK